MKKTIIVLALSCFAFVSCNNASRSGENMAMLDSISVTDSLNRLRDNTRAEIAEYRTKIRAKIDELQRDIETTRERWKAERNAKKQRELQENIDRAERNRSALQQKLDRMGDNIEEEWQEFRREVDEFFDNDLDEDKEQNANS